jgi:hypothetical protein
MEGDLTLSSAPLVDLCHQLGIATADLVAVESVDTLSHGFPLGSLEAARLDVSTVRGFVEHYADDARVEVRTGDLTEIVLGPGVTDADVAAFAAAAASGGPYEAIVQVDKARLAARIAGPSPTRVVRVFLFAESLRRALARGVTWFEANVWAEAPAPLVVAVLDTDVSLVGVHLTVAGGASLAQTREAASLPAPGEEFGAVTASRDRQIGWDTRWVGALTPWHFALSGTCADPELLNLLRAQVVKLAVLFTCDRARSRPGPTPPAEILAEYRGAQHLAVVSIDERAQLDCTEAEAAAMLRAAEWCYARHGTAGQPDWVADRLPFVQTRVAQALEPYPPEARLGALTRSMPDLLEGVEWHWKAFVEGKVGEFLGGVQQVETVVSDTVGAFSDRTAALAKGLTESILAAVAVLIGSFIAAAFSTPFNATLFRVGVLAYAGYVVLFPGAVGLISSTANLRRGRAEFDARVERLNEALYPDKVANIVGTRVADAEHSYYRWLTFVAGTYLAVAILAGVAAVSVPGLVRSSSTDHPQPTPTTTTTAASRLACGERLLVSAACR